MTEATEDKKLEYLVQKMAPGSTLLRRWELKGGVSAQMTALEIAQPDGTTKRMIVRRHGDADRQQNPQVAADEYKLLQLLQSVGIAVPTPYYLDLSGEIFSTPYIVIEYIAGESEFAPANVADCVRQLAEHLIGIHRINGSNLDLSFLPEQETICAEKLGKRPTRMDESLSEGQIRDALESVWPVPQRNQLVLLHGDFWPGNVLWKDGRLVAIIDWEDAAFGDPLADLANSRLEILWAFGADAMHDFTQHYLSMEKIDIANLPYWDLYAALRPASKLAEWGLDDSAEKAMREGHRRFITLAFEKLSAQ